MVDIPAAELTPGNDPLAFYNALNTRLPKGDCAERRAFIADALLARVPSDEGWTVCGQAAVTGRFRPGGDLDLVPVEFVRELIASDPDIIAARIETEFRRFLSEHRADHLLLTIPKGGIRRQESGLRVRVAATVDLGSGNRPIGELPVDLVLDPHTVRRTPLRAQWSFSGFSQIWPDSAVQLQDSREVWAGKLCGAYVAAKHPQISTQAGLSEAYLKYVADCAEGLEQKLEDGKLEPGRRPPWLRSNLLEFEGLDEVIAAKAAENKIVDPWSLARLPEVRGVAKKYRRKPLVERVDGETCSYHADLALIRQAVDEALRGPMDSMPVMPPPARKPTIYGKTVIPDIPRRPGIRAPIRRSRT